MLHVSFILMQTLLIAKQCSQQRIPCTCIDPGIPKAGDVKEKEELKTMFKRGKLFFDVTFDCENSHNRKIRSI